MDWFALITSIHEIQIMFTKKEVLTLCIFQIGLGELKESIEKEGLDAAFINFNKTIDNWKNAAVKLALTVKSGVGKSSFINAIRHLKSGDPGFATASGSGNTTKKQLSMNIQEIKISHYMIYQALEPHNFLEMSTKKQWHSIHMTISLFSSEILKKMILQ